MITRRALLSAAGSMVAAGKRKRRTYPVGWQQNLFPLVIVTAGPGFQGVFGYSPVPGAGNLIFSDTSHAGVDPYGNSYLEGMTDYNPTGTAFGPSAVNLNGGSIQFFTATTEAGPWTQQYQFLIPPGNITQLTVSGTGSLNLSIPLLQLAGNLTVQGTAVVTLIEALVGGVAETFHSLGTLAGWMVNRGEYRMTPDGELELDIILTGGGANAASVAFSVTLAAPYVPAATHQAPATTNRALAAGDPFPRVEVSSAGVVTVFAAANNTNSLFCQARIPLT